MTKRHIQQRYIALRTPGSGARLLRDAAAFGAAAALELPRHAAVAAATAILPQWRRLATPADGEGCCRAGQPL